MSIIGIDASRTTVTHRTGTEAYALHLIRALLAADTPHHWRLYFRDAPPTDLFPRAAHVEQRVIRAYRLWTHVGLAAEVARRRPAGLFIPAHVRPIMCAAPSVVTVHDLGYLLFPEAHPRPQRAYLHWSTRHSARRATHVIADSQTTQDDLIRYYDVAPQKVTVVYPGFDPKPFASGASAPRPQGLPDPYLLYVGTIQPRKGLIDLLDAVAALGDQPEAPTLALAGQPGWLSEPILNRAEALRLGARVRFLGYVPDDDLPALYAHAAAFVFPSLYEGFGFPVLEAMAAGAPVVCSDGGSLPEVVGAAALVVPAQDSTALAHALRRILTDDELRHTLIARGRENVRRFTWECAAEGTLHVLEKAFFQSTVNSEQ